MAKAIQNTAPGYEHWDVWYDVEDHFGGRDSEVKEFKSYAAAVRFADRHPGSAIDHYNANGELI